MSERQHSVAAICIKGHVASDGIEYRSAGKFCEDCAAPVITACPGCQTPIKGFPRDVLSTAAYYPPAYCFACGAAFPWTTEKLAVAKELADELDGVSADDRAKLKTAIEEVAAGGPRAEVGAARIKRLLGKASSGVGQALWKISVEVASEAAKKVLLGS